MVFSGQEQEEKQKRRRKATSFRTRGFDTLHKRRAERRSEVGSRRDSGGELRACDVGIGGRVIIRQQLC